MKKIAVSVLVALTLSSGAYAQNKAPAAQPAAPVTAAAQLSPASRASAKGLLEAMKYREVIASSNRQLGETLPNMLRAQSEQMIRNMPNLDDAGRKAEMAKVEKRLPEATKIMQGVLNDPKLADDLYNEAMALYSRYFTPQEMDALAAFYRTPTGQKSLNVMPQIMAESMQAGQRIVAPRLQAAMKPFKPQ